MVVDLVDGGVLCQIVSRTYLLRPGLSFSLSDVLRADALNEGS